MAASSATVPAPERETTRCAAAIRAGRSGKNGATSAAMRSRLIGFAHALEILVPRLLGEQQSHAQHEVESLDRRRHDVGHDPGALAAAEHQQPNEPALFGRGERRCRRRDHRRPQRIAGARRLGGQLRLGIEHAVK